MKFLDIFEWNDWQDFDDSFEMYMNCELKRDIGDFEAGTEFDIIYFDQKKMRLSFYKKEDDVEPVMEKRFILEN